MTTLEQKKKDLTLFGVDADLHDYVIRWIDSENNDGDEEFFESKAYKQLFDYFSSDPEEMPYGISKARDGDPEVWILRRLEQQWSKD